MCGIFGIFNTKRSETTSQEIFDALTILQHRGQDAAGVATCTPEMKFKLHKDNGLVRDAVRTRHIRKLEGNIGIGHVRYPTAGLYTSEEAQPFYVNSPFGIAISHNGNLTNAEELARENFINDLRHVTTTSDSEVLLNIFAHEFAKILAQNNTRLPKPEHVFETVKRVHARLEGSYAVVLMIIGVGLVAFRDPYAIRPLCYGERTASDGTKEYAVSSESVAFYPLDFEFVDDVAPGEALFIDWDGLLHKQQCSEKNQLSPCIFEYVYLARPDSIIDGISVYKTRLRMGEMLAKKIKKLAPKLDADVVIPIPESSRPSALQLANDIGLKYREGFVKNRYIGRTFIMPGQSIRKKSVKHKLSAMPLEFKDKNVILVDDSIVRGTTSKQIVDMAREAGAKKVYFAVAAPPVRFPNVYGIDMPSRRELIAHGRTEEEIGKLIGADGIFYQDLDDLIVAAQEGNAEIKNFDCSCFNGEYVTGTITDDYLSKIEEDRADSTKKEQMEKSKDF